MPFVDPSESLVHGFECGQIWQKISEGETFTGYLIHTVNIKQIEMICERFGIECDIEVYDETWSGLTVNSVFNNQNS